MGFQQLETIVLLCLGSRYGARFVLPCSLIVFVIGALWRHWQQHVAEAILLQTLSLIGIWVVYLGNCLPWLRDTRNNKSFRLIQSQKAICYWMALSLSYMVAILTLLYLIAFGHPEIANAIFAVGISIVSMGMNVNSATGELKQICSTAFGSVMLINLAHWFMDSPFPLGRWLVFLIGIIVVFYLWFIYRNYFNWINRAGYGSSSDPAISKAAPYLRRNDSQNN